MSKNKFGRDRIVLVYSDVRGTNAETCVKFLEDIEQYEFQEVQLMEECANKAGIKLVSFRESTGRAPLHSYEEEHFREQQMMGDIQRIPTKLISSEEETNMSKANPKDNISAAVDPKHYKDVIPGFQYMEMMQYMLADKTGVESHLLGQVYKYLLRAGKKDDVEQEYRKAKWYLNCLIKFKQTGEVDCGGND